MRFLIRDDDTNYFTKPEELMASYGEVWDTCPISLSVVPFHGRTKSRAIPPEYWPPANGDPDEVFPIGDNRELVGFLKERIKLGQVCLTLHGYSHRDVRPEPGGYEFEIGENLEYKVRQGKRYLEQVFEVPIRVFVPPHNSLSATGAAAVFNNGLILCGTLGRRAWRNGPKVWRNLLVRKWWEYRQGGPYPYPMRYGDHLALGFQGLTPAISLQHLRSVLQHFQRWNGWFCLATHHWEFGAQQQTGENMSMGEVFHIFWQAVKKLPDIQFTPLNAVSREGT